MCAAAEGSKDVNDGSTEHTASPLLLPVLVLIAARMKHGAVECVVTTDSGTG